MIFQQLLRDFLGSSIKASIPLQAKDWAMHGDLELKNVQIIPTHALIKKHDPASGAYS
jgi:hypothetical protein